MHKTLHKFKVNLYINEIHEKLMPFSKSVR